jgi:hypothetical protein
MRRDLCMSILVLIVVMATAGTGGQYVAGDVPGQVRSAAMGREPAAPSGIEPVYGERASAFEMARERYPGEYSRYSEYYAGRGQWQEVAAPGVPVAENRLVRRYIREFQTTRRRDFTIWLRRAGRYLPFVRRILIENGLPGELTCLAMVESGFDPRAVSRAGAVGLWQFMPETARRYGLRVDGWVDERLDPGRSTVAASVFLRDLYNRYGSWDLVIAAYNAGEGRVSRAIYRTGCRDFWSLARRGYFTSETRYHVVKFNAALKILRNLDGYGFRNVELDAPLCYEKADVHAGLSMGHVSALIGIPGQDGLDPELLSSKIPPDRTHYLPGADIPIDKEGPWYVEARPVS